MDVRARLDVVSPDAAPTATRLALASGGPGRLADLDPGEVERHLDVWLDQLREADALGFAIDDD